jgi:molybdopterin-guanine dinucleotide biosynthesis protein B
VIPILSIVGRSNSGKTTLLERLIPELCQRGYAVVVDVPGKDSWRHKQAGARTAALASRDTLFVVCDAAGEWPLDAIAHLALFDVDLILTEGFKASAAPKIEVIRGASGGPLLCGPGEHLVAVVADGPSEARVPHFGPGEVARLAEFVEREFLTGGRPSPVDLLVGGRRVRLDEGAAEVLARVVRSLVPAGPDGAGDPPIELRIRRRAP